MTQPTQLGTNQALNISQLSARSNTQPQNEKPNQIDRNMYMSEVTAPGTTELIKAEFKQPNPKLIQSQQTVHPKDAAQQQTKTAVAQ